jgi:hypothetical protein
MTETAEQRTKRQFNKYLDMVTWTHQYSFFYQCADDAKANALEDAPKLKEKLRRTKALTSQSFLYRLCLYRANAYHTVFTTSPIDLDLLHSLILKVSPVEINVAGRELLDWKIETYRRAVSKQRPHNLVAFFGNRKINRIALLNAKAIS